MAKKTLLTCTLLLGLAPMMTSCVTTQDHRNLQLKMRNQNNRIVEMEEQLHQLQAGGGESTKALQRQQADIATSMDHLKTTLLQLQGQVEEATYRNRALLEDNQKFQHELDNKMISLEEQDQQTKALLETTSNQVSTITTNLEQEAKRKEEDALRRAALAKEKALQAERARKKAQADLIASQKNSGIKELTPRMEKGKSVASKSATPVTSTEVKPVTITPVKETPTAGKTAAEKLYDKGLGNYRSNKYKDAIKHFTQFLDENNKHKLVPNAKYWLGASRLKDGDYSGAVLEFQHIVADYPKHSKAPEALLKQAEAFAHFGDKMVQKKLYKDVMSYYPKSEQAKIAKDKLSKL